MTPQQSPGGCRAGLTLIEVLVAVSLMALLAAGLSTALAVSAGAWRDTRERLTLDRRVANSNHLIHALFAAAVPVVARPLPATGAPPAPFFHGEPRQMRFVTSYTLGEGARGGLEIAELNVMEAREGLRLVLTRSPYLGPLSTGRFVIGMNRGGGGEPPRLLFAPVTPRSDSLILADGLAACSFEFQRESRGLGDPAVWLPVWGDLQQIPAAVRILLEPRDKEARLQPVSMTAEIRARYAPAIGPGQAGPPRLAPDVEEIVTPQGVTLRRRGGR